MALLDSQTVTIEERLAALCARSSVSDERRREVDSLANTPGIDWNQFLDIVHWQKIPGLAFRTLGRSGCKSVPREVTEALKVAYMHASLLNFQHREVMREIVPELQRAGIPTMALKGAFLLEHVYRDAGIRSMSDVDLMVPAHQLNEAGELLGGLGYQSEVIEEVALQMEDSSHQLPRLLKTGTDSVVELHWHVIPKTSAMHERFDISRMWAQAETAEIAGVEVLAPRPEHMLIHLAIHFLRDRQYHSHSGLSQLCDIAETVATFKDRVDWTIVERESDVLGVRKPVACSLSLAASLVDAQVPADVIGRMRAGEFTEADELLILRQRIFRIGRFTATALVEPTRKYTALNAARGMARRIFPSRRYLAKTAQDRKVMDSPGGAYFRRWIDALSKGLNLVRRPALFRDDLKADRLIHNLAAATTVASDD